MSKKLEVYHNGNSRCSEALSEQKPRHALEAEKETMAKARRERVRKASDRLLRGILVALGTCFVALGVLGIFLPLLPTTPFLLLAVACYARSSERFHNWLLNNRWFGTYLRNYREGRGIALRVKILTVLLLWTTIGCSAAFAVDNIAVRVILSVIAIGVTIHIVTVRTLRHSEEVSE